jgi:hypothetical protein
MSSLDNEIDHIKAIGGGAISLVNTAIVLAIVAVVLSNGSQAPAVITAFFGWLSWLIGQVITSTTPGATPTPIGAGAGTAGGLPSGALPPGWSSTYAPGLLPAATTLPDGTVVYGYSPQ